MTYFLTEQIVGKPLGIAGGRDYLINHLWLLDDILTHRHILQQHEKLERAAQNVIDSFKFSIGDVSGLGTVSRHASLYLPVLDMLGEVALGVRVSQLKTDTMEHPFSQAWDAMFPRMSRGNLMSGRHDPFPHRCIPSGVTQDFDSGKKSILQALVAVISKRKSKILEAASEEKPVQENPGNLLTWLLDTSAKHCPPLNDISEDDTVNHVRSCRIFLH